MHPLWPAILLATLAAAAPFVTNKATSISYQGTSADGVDQFQGIFFAEDTSGPNRFAPPKPYHPSRGTVIQATMPGAACPQATHGAAPFMSDVNDQSENCLSLRIARPADLRHYKKPLPVMVWIYGGGAILGEAYDELFNPVGLVQQSVANGQPVLYVAMNYRIGIFGFASAKVLRDAKSENVGLRDQYAAIEWVKDNIAAFGGDPGDITLFGQSFGSISIGLQMVAYGGEREALFHKAIMTSSGISGDRSNEFVRSNTAAVAEALKCTSNSGTIDDSALECMRETPLATLLKVQLAQATKVRPSFGFAAFTAVIDGDLIPDQPYKLLQEGRFSKHIPVIATWAADDGSMSADTAITTDDEVVKTFSHFFPNFSPAIASKILSLYPVHDFEDQARGSTSKVSAQYFRASRIVRDIDMACPSLAITRQVHRYGGTKVYVAELNSTRLLPYWDAFGAPWGVSHLSDLPYIFNERIPAPGDNSPAALELSSLYSGSFAAFANTGSPVREGKGTFSPWPVAYSDMSQELTVLVIGGPYGTGSVTIGEARAGRDRRAVALEQVPIGDLSEVDSVPVGSIRDRRDALTAAFKKEKLWERCAYIDSARR